MPETLSRSEKRDKYSEIFTDYYQIVYNAVYPKVNSVDDTEDICQEVFIALYNHLEEINNVRAWLYGTLRNMVLQYYRKKYPMNENIDNMMDDISLSFVNGFRDTRIIISSSLDEVISGEEERNIVELVAFHNYSYSETAEIMGLTKRQVEYKYTQLARKLEAQLKEKGISSIEDLL